MENVAKPKLVFFRYSRGETLVDFMQLHRHHHVKCLSQFFDVIVIQEDCDYQQICDKYQPNLVLFEMLSSDDLYTCQKLKITNIYACPEIPKIALHNADAWCDSRAGFISDMENWGIETIFSICTTAAEHTPEIAEKIFVWPNFIDTDICRDYGESKIIPVLFTGAKFGLYPWRQKIYSLVSEYYPSLICPHRGYHGRSSAWQVIHGEQYARTINASWFVPTCGTVAKEVVRKHFEIPGSKSCLITEKSPSLEAAGFVDMENCVFVDEHDVLDKLDYLFQNLDELKRITNAGYQLVHSRHTLNQRDQIFQWFNLSKNLKPNQKIVQTNPFEPLTVVEKSSGIKNSHIICNGLHLALLRQGDEKLWAGKYDEAETLYLKCLNYVYWMPEPRFRLALYNLYKGNAEKAHHWIFELVQFIFKVHKSVDPDPVEWAYLIISLLCLGKLDEAVKLANQFPLLMHPELDRTRWAIKSLTDISCVCIPPHDDQAKYRYSIHQLPNRSHDDWVNNLCSMLKANHQVHLAEKLRTSVVSEDFLINEQKYASNTTEIKSWATLNLIYKSWQNRITVALNHRPARYKRTRLRPNYTEFGTRLKSKLERANFKLLNYLEPHFGYFLPYHRSVIRNDEFFGAIHKLVKQEDIKVALLIGASVTEGSTKAFLAGIQENSNKPISFCVNPSITEFAKLQKHYSNDPFVRCHRVESTPMENFSIKLESEIKRIKQENRIDCFDVVLIDSSQLTNKIELDDIFCEAGYVLLDDINDFQNYKNHNRMLRDTNYVLVAQNPGLRNGYAIFKKVNLQLG